MTDYKTRINFNDHYSDYAVFIPAISEMYSKYVNHPDPKREPPFPRQWLDFLQPDTELFYIPNVLYSAGQVAGSKQCLTEKNKKKDMVMSRDPQYSTVIGDSGGFQVETGVLKWKGDETREIILRWLEKYCDWSMILDFPTGSITRRGEEFSKQYGLEPGQEAAFEFCLNQTKANNDYFVKHRVPGATKFLNVIQGLDWTQTDRWYDEVKDYPFEGWALAGNHRSDFWLTMRRLLIMRDEGYLTNKDWLHFLGQGRVKNGCVFTTIQRMIRKHINPNLTVSYDVSSPFSSAAYGLMFYDFNMDSSKWSISTHKAPDHPSYVGSKTTLEEYILEFNEKKKKRSDLDSSLFDLTEDSELNLPSTSPISKYLTLGDLCVNPNPEEKTLNSDLSSDLIQTENKNKKYKTSWDSLTYALIMNHNTYVQMACVFEGQRQYDIGNTNRVPSELLEIRDIIEEGFEREDWEEFLTKNKKTLLGLNNIKSTAVSVYDSLFEQ